MLATTTWGVRHEQARQQGTCADRRAFPDRWQRAMTGQSGPTGMKQAESNPNEGLSAQPAAITQPRILIVGADPATLGLFQEWLAAGGYHVVDEESTDRVDRDRFALAIIDAPFPRQSALDLLQRVTNEHPGTPVLAHSSAFFSSVTCCGGVAHKLGVACVLPKPAAREALIAAVHRVLGPTA
jgi:CheY-like chemotaxis protein